MLTMQQLQNFRQHATFGEVFTAEAQEQSTRITEAGAHFVGCCTSSGKPDSKLLTLPPG